MKLIQMVTGTNIATVECECGGRTLIATTGATEAAPKRGRCPMCIRTFDYPTDLEK